MRTLRGAFLFLTILPVRGPAVEPGRAAALFPLVGALLGWVGAGVFLTLREPFGAGLASAITLAFWAALTGGLHEDGLADVADAFRAHRPPARILAIMKDSRIGAFGALAIVFSALIRWQALAQLKSNELPALVACLAIPRAAMVGLAWIARPAGNGLGAAFSASLTTGAVALALAQGIGFALLCGARPGVALIASAALIAVAARFYFHARLGGVTGDCLGAASQVVETVLLILVSCGGCGW